jgi:hypothetical protein
MMRPQVRNGALPLVLIQPEGSQRSFCSYRYRVSSLSKEDGVRFHITLRMTARRVEYGLPP